MGMTVIVVVVCAGVFSGAFGFCAGLGIGALIKRYARDRKHWRRVACGAWMGAAVGAGVAVVAAEATVGSLNAFGTAVAAVAIWAAAVNALTGVAGIRLAGRRSRRHRHRSQSPQSHTRGTLHPKAVQPPRLDAPPVDSPMIARSGGNEERQTRRDPTLRSPE